MGKSRFEALETAVRERNKVGTSNISNQVQIESFKTQIASLEQDLAAKIKRIENSPIDKDALKVKAESDRSMMISRAANKVELDKSNRSSALKTMISDAEAKKEKALADANRVYETSVRTHLTQQVKDKLADQESDRWLEEQKQKAEYNYKESMAKIGNSQETINMQIDEARSYHQKEADGLNAQLRALEQASDLVEEQKSNWDALYKDIVEISKCSSE